MERCDPYYIIINKTYINTKLNKPQTHSMGQDGFTLPGLRTAALAHFFLITFANKSDKRNRASVKRINPYLRANPAPAQVFKLTTL